MHSAWQPEHIWLSLAGRPASPAFGHHPSQRVQVLTGLQNDDALLEPAVPSCGLRNTYGFLSLGVLQVRHSAITHRRESKFSPAFRMTMHSLNQPSLAAAS